MNFKNSFWSRIATKFPWLTKFAIKKQSESKVDGLSESIVDKRTPAWKPLSLLLPTLIIIAMFTIFPLILNIKNAFWVKTTEITQNGQVSITRFSFQNFSDLLEQPMFAVAVRNSLMYGLIVLPFVMAISLTISSLIATLYRKVAKGFWQTIFFLPYVTNAVAISLAFIQIFSPNGMFNSIFGFNTAWLEKGEETSMAPLLPMIIQGIWQGLAFNILIFTTAMLSVDKNLYKSASIDGVGPIKQFFTITLPSIKSTTTFLITMGIIGGIKVFPLALFNNKLDDAIKNGAASLMLLVYRATQSGDYPAAGAAAITLFIIGIIFSTIIRGGFSTIMKASYNLGESNVWNKIKDSEVIIEYQAKKKQRAYS